MSRDDKLIERIRRRPPEADFRDVRRLLEMYGYAMRKGGKHTAVFSHPTLPSVTVPTISGRRVKRAYLDGLCKLLGLDD